MATRYHRLARETPEHAWWKLPVVGAIIVGGFLVGTVAVVGIAAALLEAAGRSDALEEIGDLPSPRVDPGLFAVAMLSIAILLPIVVLAMLAAGRRFVGGLCSVTGRLRWSWLLLTTGLAFVVAGVCIGTWIGAYALGASDDVRITPASLDGRALGALALVLAITPFQAAAEEFLFRGYLTQLIGTWTRWWIVGAVVTTLGFTALHGYETWGLVDVGIFGFTAAVLTVRTGGLEAAIGLHAANNIVLMGLDATGVDMLSSRGEEYVAVDVLPTVVMCVVFTVVVDRLVVRRGIARTRDPIVVPPPKPVQRYTLAHPGGWAPPPWQTPTWQHWAPAPPPVPAPPRIHPEAPPYPGELGAEWARWDPR